MCVLTYLYVGVFLCFPTGRFGRTYAAWLCCGYNLKTTTNLDIRCVRLIYYVKAYVVNENFRIRSLC
jgi:hypothetical protein